MDVTEIKENQWYWIPKYVSMKEAMPAKVTGIEEVNTVALQVLETKFRAKPGDIFPSEDLAVEADKTFMEKAKAVERSPFAYALLVSIVPAISIRIIQGTVNRYEKDPNSKAMQYNWNFCPYEVNGKTMQIPFDNVFPSLAEAREAAEKYRKDMSEWHKKRAEVFLSTPIIEKTR